jgi:adenine-specific DNA-methyltransferase
MDKLQMQSKNLVDENIAYIARKFPNCITEAKDENGKIIQMVDFELLKQELSKVIIDGDKERYMMTWPDKKQAILTANAPIAKTLRPCKEESVDFDNTQNLYIEGDNLDVLKLLRETYLNKVKMIYIDPPYNTGNDFVYEDDFAIDTEEYLQRSNQLDEQGNRMVTNNDSNGRFHTDWLNMIYPRLKVAKDLLTDDGVIFISIDDNEQTNLQKICDEIFGKNNFVMNFIRKTVSQRAMAKYSNIQHEYCLCYAKNIFNISLIGEEKKFENYTNPDNDTNGDWQVANPSMSGSKNTFGVKNPYTNKIDYPPIGRGWCFKQDQIQNLIEKGKFVFLKTHKENQRGFILKAYKNDIRSNTSLVNSLDFCGNEFMNQVATKEWVKLFSEKTFDYSKPLSFIKKINSYNNSKDSIILDFFSGSATTAHAVMQLNAEDYGNRKFIMVQLPELTDETSEAYKAGYKNICEIGKERIRRAGEKIKAENPMAAQNLDIGFRMLKLDSSNMKDVYYNPIEYNQDLLERLGENIKEDRVAEDLLFQVMLDMGALLSSEIRVEMIQGKKVFNVNEGNLICCFDKKINEEVITQIAKQKPLYAVFRDSSLENDTIAVNFDQIFETYSPTTIRKVL